MTTHTVKCVGFVTDDPSTISAPTSGSDVGTQDIVTVATGDRVAVPTSVGDYLGVTFALYDVDATAGWTTAAVQPTAGDLVAVVGSLGVIPDWQAGMLWVVNDDGVAFMANAGHLASVIP